MMRRLFGLAVGLTLPLTVAAPAAADFTTLRDTLTSGIPTYDVAQRGFDDDIIDEALPRESLEELHERFRQAIGKSRN